jgi:hypothetical protein
MKLASFEVDTRIGPAHRVGVLRNRVVRPD